MRYEELTHSAHFTRLASAEARKYKDTNPEFEDVFYEVANREPSNELLVYKEVNGHWPAGYPLKMSNYI